MQHNQDAVDILELLKRDHMRVDDLLDQLQATDETDDRRRAQLFARVVAELEVHSDAEDQVVYSALESRTGFEELIEDARQEHEQIEQLVEELDEVELTDPAWIAKVGELRHLVRHHVDEEEGTLFPRMSEAFDARQRQDLAVQFMIAREADEEEELSGEQQPVRSEPNGEPDLETMSKRDLYELARTRHIDGRSAMTKAELVIAIRAAR